MIKFVIEINTEKQASHDIAGNKEHAAVVGDDIYGKKDTVVGTDNFGSEMARRIPKMQKACTPQNPTERKRR